MQLILVRAALILAIVLTLPACALFQPKYNHAYANLPAPVHLYFSPHAEDLSLEAKLALNDMGRYLQSNPKLRAQVVVHEDNHPAPHSRLNYFAQRAGDELIGAGARPKQVSISEGHTDAKEPSPYVAVRLTP